MQKIWGLLFKNWKIQRTFYCGLAAQLLTPVICVFFIFSIKHIVNKLAPEDFSPLDAGLFADSGFAAAAKKIPFTLAVPINLPLTRKQIERLYREKLHVWSCYQSLRYGVASEASAAFLEGELGLSSQSKARQKECTVRFQKEPLQTPQVQRAEGVGSLADVDRQVFEEVAVMDTYNMMYIEDTRYPSDAYYFFRAAGEDRVEADLVANNFGMVYYHHNNFLNSVATENYVRISLITETFMTQVDLLSNALLERLSSKLGGSPWRAPQKPSAEPPGRGAPLDEASHSAQAQRLSQIVTLSLSFPGVKLNQLATFSLVLIPAIFFFSMAVGLGTPLVMTFLQRDFDSRMHYLMRVNGVSKRDFYAGNALYWFGFLALVSLVFWVTGSLLIPELFFTWRTLGPYFGFMLLWNALQVALAFAVMTFASLREFCASLGVIIASVSLFFGFNIVSFVYPSFARMSPVLLLFPHFCYVRLLYLLMIKAISTLQPTERTELATCYTILFFQLTGLCLVIFLKENLTWAQIVSRLKRRRAARAPAARREAPGGEEHPSVRRLRKQIELIGQSQSEGEEPFLLFTEKLTKRYSGGKLALSELDLGIRRGEVFGLLGPNGAGKTTFFSLVTGFAKSSAGSFYFDEALTKLAYCPQENILWPFLTVRDHLEIFSHLRGKALHDAAEIERVLRLTKLEAKAASKVKTLSGGMKRRLSLGISLVGDSQLILLDEPTTGLDSKRRRELWEIVRALRGSKTFILSTHMMQEANFLCDRVGVLDKGRLRIQGELREVIGEFGGNSVFQIRLTGRERLRREDLQALGEISRWDKKVVRVELQSGVGMARLTRLIEEFGLASWELRKPSLESAFHRIYRLYN